MLEGKTAGELATACCRPHFLWLLHLLCPTFCCPQRRLRQEVFLREVIPWWLAPVGYGGLAIISTIFIPMVYTPAKWYYVAVAYLVTPLFALPNSYGAGLTDWDCASMYGKLALFVFAAWAGAEVRVLCAALAAERQLQRLLGRLSQPAVNVPLDVVMKRTDLCVSPVAAASRN
jgi:hypothetical protein